MPSLTKHCVVGGLLFAGLLNHACAQSIFTCVDAKGRRLTADRPIAECTDREQTELRSSGTVKRKIGPTLTASEQAAAQARERRMAEERSRQAEEKKREKALLARYPDRGEHDKERAAAIALADAAIAAANKRIAELRVERKRLDVEMEFFKNDLARAPATLKRKFEDNAHDTQAQQRFVANQEADRKRINARFDEELVKLTPLWAQHAATAAATGTAVAKP